MKLIFGIVIVALTSFLISCGEETMRTATFETSLGTFTVELSDRTPSTTKNFIDLASAGFYDGTKFHRVIAGFMIQGGDPLTKDDLMKPRWGTGGPGYEIIDEFDPSLSNVRGTLSMANHGPNTGGSQFFINVADNTYLDNKHAVFGTVVDGRDVVNRISRANTNELDQPIEDITLSMVRIS